MLSMLATLGKYNHHVDLDLLHHVAHVGEVGNRKSLTNLLGVGLDGVANRGKSSVLDFLMAEKFRMPLRNAATPH
jgi:hypothetical protein